MDLRPHDILVALKLALLELEPSYAKLARDLELSTSEAHGAVKRCHAARLVHPETRAANRSALLEFLVHGLKYVLPPRRGPLVRGMPTAHGVYTLAESIQSREPPPVWPTADGESRGESLEPICRSAPGAARRDLRLYECLALVDAIRAGRARERGLAEQRLREILAP